MKYTKQQRLDIGRRIYDGEITRYQASELYNIEESTARNYMRMYRDANNLPAKHGRKGFSTTVLNYAPSLPTNIQAYQSVSKEELILELVKARIAEARLKKRLRGEMGWFGNPIRQQEYQIILEFSGYLPIIL